MTWSETLLLAGGLLGFLFMVALGLLRLLRMIWDAPMRRRGGYQPLERAPDNPVPPRGLPGSPSGRRVIQIVWSCGVVRGHEHGTREEAKECIDRAGGGRP